MKTAARELLAPALAALALTAAPALRADDGFRPIFHPPTFQIHDVQVKTSFKGLDGKTQPAGLYDFGIEQRGQAILIGLLRNGKRVGEATGKFVPGAADPPGGSQGHDISVRKAGGMQDIHFDASSKVAFGDGGGAGKISCSNNLHPGGANLGWIQFQLPPGPPNAR